MAEYKKGDRFFYYDTVSAANYIFTLEREIKSGKIQYQGWIALDQTNDHCTLYYSELDDLLLFGYPLIPIRDDKHLLELMLKYG
jgi:hypothetical protein